MTDAGLQKFSRLIAEFSAHYEMDDLTPDDNGVTGFVVDNREMALQLLPEGEVVLASIELGTSSEATTANLLLMKANQSLFALDGMVIGIRAESGQYCLFDRIDISHLDFPGFDARIARILERAEQWGAFLGAFVPTAVAADSAGDAESEHPEGELSLGNFIHV